jgi:hypothetical protein
MRIPRRSQDANGTTARPLVIQVRLEDEVITPITARFVGRAIDLAGDQRAECLVNAQRKRILNPLPKLVASSLDS